MVDTKISALSAASVAAIANELAINEAGTSKKISITQLITLLQTLGMPRVAKLGSQHDNSTATGTKVTGLDMALEAGTYMVDYRLIARSGGTVGTGLYLGVNFSTGTAAVKSFWMDYADASATLLAALGTMADTGAKALGFRMSQPTKAYTTTAPDLGTSVGFKTDASDTMIQVSGIIVVTVAGTLELWHSSETTTLTSVMVGSSVKVIRTA